MDRLVDTLSTVEGRLASPELPLSPELTITR